MTLIELLVVIALLGCIAGVVGLAMPGVPAGAPMGTSATLFKARRRAVNTAMPVVVSFEDSIGGTALILPDGTVIADSSRHIDQFTGRLALDPEREP